MAFVYQTTIIGTKNVVPKSHSFLFPDLLYDKKKKLLETI